MMPRVEWNEERGNVQPSPRGVAAVRVLSTNCEVFRIGVGFRVSDVVATATIK